MRAVGRRVGPTHRAAPNGTLSTLVASAAARDRSSSLRAHSRSARPSGRRRRRRRTRRAGRASCSRRAGPVTPCAGPDRLAVPGHLEPGRVRDLRGEPGRGSGQAFPWYGETTTTRRTPPTRNRAVPRSAPGRVPVTSTLGTARRHHADLGADLVRAARGQCPRGRQSPVEEGKAECDHGHGSQHGEAAPSVA